MLEVEGNDKAQYIQHERWELCETKLNIYLDIKYNSYISIYEFKTTVHVVFSTIAISFNHFFLLTLCPFSHFHDVLLLLLSDSRKLILP